MNPQPCQVRAKSPDIGPSSVVVASSSQISTGLDGEAVILNMSAGTYYSLEAVGAEVWWLVQSPKTVRELHVALLGAYEVEPERCERDLVELLAELHDAGLVEVTSGQAG